MSDYGHDEAMRDLHAMGLVLFSQSVVSLDGCEDERVGTYIERLEAERDKNLGHCADSPRNPSQPSDEQVREALTLVRFGVDDCYDCTVRSDCLRDFCDSSHPDHLTNKCGRALSTLEAALATAEQEKRVLERRIAELEAYIADDSGKRVSDRREYGGVVYAKKASPTDPKPFFSIENTSTTKEATND